MPFDMEEFNILFTFLIFSLVEALNGPSAAALAAAAAATAAPSPLPMVMSLTSASSHTSSSHGRRSRSKKQKSNVGAGNTSSGLSGDNNQGSARNRDLDTFGQLESDLNLRTDIHKKDTAMRYLCSLNLYL